MLEAVMRWVRVRGLKEGKMQRGRVEGSENDARDDAQRPQDYGFAASPVDGEGLKIEFGGHTVILRVDRINERPALAAYEVAVWHREGHMVKLKAGRVIEMVGDQLIANMSQGIAFNSPTLTHNGVNVGATHTHPEDEPGPGFTGLPQ
jgi:phage gp45-like